MTRAFTFEYVGSSTGYGAPTTVFTDATLDRDQLAWIRQSVSDIVNGNKGASGWPVRYEFWRENFPVTKWVARYPTDLAKPTAGPVPAAWQGQVKIPAKVAASA